MSKQTQKTPIEDKRVPADVPRKAEKHVEEKSKSKVKA